MGVTGLVSGKTTITFSKHLSFKREPTSSERTRANQAKMMPNATSTNSPSNYLITMATKKTV